MNEFLFAGVCILRGLRFTGVLDISRLDKEIRTAGDESDLVWHLECLLAFPPPRYRNVELLGPAPAPVSIAHRIRCGSSRRAEVDAAPVELLSDALWNELLYVHAHRLRRRPLERRAEGSARQSVRFLAFHRVFPAADGWPY